MKKILMVALDFPPCKSAGVQRTLKFAEYLVDLGWEPIILTVEESAHEQVDHSQEISPNIRHIYRSFSYNASRDFSIKGKYLRVMKEPDRWWSWRFSAIPLGKKLIDQFKPDVIWSTYPVSTAHSIAYNLMKYSGLPWIADYRDPVQSRYDSSAKQTFKINEIIERNTINAATKLVFTTEPASVLYQSLYPDLPLDKFNVIENGYDEANFAKSTVDHNNGDINKFTLLHSGAVYRNGRDPSELFLAIASLKKSGAISSDTFELVFRGINGAEYQTKLNELDIADVVLFKPSISYVESLNEMMSSSALLLIQGPLFRNQIPGKLYEYIRTYKPILAITSSIGATAECLETVSGAYAAQYADEIEQALQQILTIKHQQRSQQDTERFSRYHKTKELVNLLDSLELQSTR